MPNLKTLRKPELLSAAQELQKQVMRLETRLSQGKSRRESLYTELIFLKGRGFWARVFDRQLNDA